MSLSLTMAPSTQATSPSPMSPEEAQKRKEIAATAKEFEASFLSVMVGQMFSGVNSPAMFGGGAGEDAFKSFMSDAMAKQMAKSGGLGLSGAVQTEMLKLQGLN